MKGLTLIILILLVSSCNFDKRTPSTREMSEELQTIALEARQNNNYPYFTQSLLKKLEIGVRGMPYTMNTSGWLDYVLVLLLKGDNEECIQIIDEYLEANEYDKVTHASLSFFKVKALAYLRQGEIQNCIQNHSGQSCIMPIRGKGVHILKTPVNQAIEIYQRLLEFDNTDTQSKWFLNLCYQAVGDYPDRVPPEFLIPPEVFESDIDFPTFPNVSMETGTDLNNHAGGSSIEDFNNDGLLDIFTTSYSLAEPSTLYINEGTGRFVDRTIEYGLEGLVGGLNNCHADFNNDGLMDIYIMRGAWLAKSGQIPNSLLINKGSKFSDETRSSGLYSKSPTGAVAIADYDLDGYLDLFVGNESSGRGAIFPCQLYRNNGDGTFTDQAPDLGLEVNQFVKGAIWGDVNNDLFPDLYLSIYNGKNKLFMNRGTDTSGNWMFEEIAAKSGVSEPIMSFPTWFWDYNQDGWQDLMVLGYDNTESYKIAGEVAKDYMGDAFQGETPRLYRNNGDETFTDVTEEAGLNRLLYAMGGNFGDLNNDGYPDFYLGTGEFNIWASIPNRAFLNQDGKRFVDITSAGEFGQIQKGHGVAFGDLDNDGDQDIYHQVGGAAESDVFQNMLFENPGFGNHWISLEFVGSDANRSALGSRVEIVVKDSLEETRTIYHQVGTGGSFGANTLRAEIGLGEAVGIVEVKIYWPDKDRSTQVLTNLKLDRHYRINQKEPEALLLNRIPVNLNSQSSHAHHH